MIFVKNCLENAQGSIFLRKGCQKVVVIVTYLEAKLLFAIPF